MMPNVLAGSAPEPIALPMGRKKRPPTAASKAVTSAFARRMRGWREWAGLTQLDVAYKCTMSMDTVRSYETGRRVPRLTEIADLATVIGVSPQDLMFKDPPVKKD